MKPIHFTIAIVLMALCGSTVAQQATLTTKDYDKAVSMLSFNTSSLMSGGVGRVQWLPNGNMWYAENGKFVMIDPKTGEKKIANSLKEFGVEESAPQQRGRRGQGTGVASPDGQWSAYIKDWNLYIRNSRTNVEVALTTDGVKDYGYATDNAGWTHSERAILLWSPDSKKIATFRQDQRHISDMYLVKTTVGAPELEEWKYPLPEDDSVIMIKRIIIDIETAKIIPLQTPTDPRRGTLCDDISCSGSFDDNEWSADSKQLAFVSSSRDHKVASFKVANAQTGAVRTVYTETVPTQYESGRGSINWRFLPETNEFIWYSQRSDWGHLYLYDLTTGKLKNAITAGNFVVTKIVKLDTKSRTIYFDANGKEPGQNPYFSHFYSVDFGGKAIASLTPDLGNHSITLSPDAQYFIDVYSTPSTPSTTALRSIKGKKIADLGKDDMAKLTATGWKPPMEIVVKSADKKYDLYGLMFSPSKLVPGKKYPVINYIYPGPQGGSVGSWSFSAGRSDHQALAELGFVVVLIEGTCNPGRSKSFHDECYGNMYVNTLPDQISGIKQLAAQHNYLDLDKVGVWGHSGGGYATAAAMFNYPEFYKVGISESGNHENRNYEDDWGERYIGLMTKTADGKTNYDPQANALYANKLEGKLMIAHGGMDDNVPPYNSYLVVDALVKANKTFDLVIFPNARHGYGADGMYMMRRRWDYFVENLMGAKPPKDYKITVGRR